MKRSRASHRRDVMTPEWSHALAEVCQSPIWQSLDGMERKDAFVEAASAYTSYEALPTRLKAIYQEAYRQLPGSGRR